jgi:hypothetical protein
MNADNVRADFSDALRRRGLVPPDDLLPDGRFHRCRVDTTPEITLITKRRPNTTLSKRIFLDEGGALMSDGSQCRMVEGVATRAFAASARDLAGHIAACGPDQAIALGALKPGLASPATIVTKQNLDPNSGAITRSRDSIDYQPGTRAWMLIDFDAKGMPPEVAACIEAMDGVWRALTTVAPVLQDAARVSRASTSSGLFREDTGEHIADAGGLHVYVQVKDGGDVSRFLHALHDRCWLHGLGWHVIGRSGSLLERSLVDCTVGYGERLCFEGQPIIEPPLKQDISKREPQAVDGQAIETALILSKLSEYQQHLVREAKAVSADKLSSEAKQVRERYDDAVVEKLGRAGTSLPSARRQVRARHGGILLPDVELDFDDLGVVTVAMVLAKPDKFVGETLADPLEGVDYGRCKAKVMRAHDGALVIHSFAHGGGLYHPRHDARSASAALANAIAALTDATPAGIVDDAMAILAISELEPDEIAGFAKTVADAAGLSVSAVKARMEKERRERVRSQRQAALHAEADGRIVRDRPEPDGELTPTVIFVDELLASDRSEEPPMRDASGNLVEVRVLEPWALHELNPDGTNAADGGDVMGAPKEPTLVRLTTVTVSMVIERYVRWWIVTKHKEYFGQLPRSHIDALMQLTPSSLPVARAINTAPLISRSGTVIDGAGLDRKTGLVHRIDPLLRACLPGSPPTEQDVRGALRFLLDEWLVDVALDDVGKCVAIMQAMTLIERALLQERPAFFVVAPQRGGGKTTLVIMITLAALGRRAAAAAWSDNAEERKKALFSYLRRGVACLVWDNIARGSTISCPHIEAALTAAEISDRVLGVSRVETVPSTTVQVFTGNAIGPRADMASRSLMIALNVDRPDPENRAFVHPDPLGWTKTHRGQIVRALYVLLLAGAANRPVNQEAKTRFKSWWTLVGWPMEYAAGLLGIKVDCTELMRAGEAGDEEASATSAALTILQEIWPDCRFSAKQVVKAIEAKDIKWLAGPSEADDAAKTQAEALADALAAKAQAEALDDALGELDGRRLDRPTAHKIGKLFQKRLVGRPALIRNDQIATLRRTKAHEENNYRVEVSTPGKNNPDNPDIPGGSGSTAVEAGNVGKDGKVSGALRRWRI